MSAPAGSTIFALSSGALPAAIGVVRVSGPGAAEALRSLSGRLPAPRRATTTLLTTPDGTTLDRALVLWLPGPGTATGEDTAELHLHGGRATVSAVLAALADLPGLTPAEPGAFTRRAVENGRLDLTEAEGLADLLEAQTEGQRRAALRLAEGGLGQLIGRWQGVLLGLAARAEAAIEFAEEHDDVTPDSGIATDAEQLADEIAEALKAPPAERLRDGVRVLIAGPVNAGKSTLLNALVGREVAIALPQAGTTRDLIETPVSMAGLPILFIDSAGLREAGDLAERMGVERARAAMATADLILWLGEPGDQPAGRSIVIQTMADREERSVARAGVDLIVSARTGCNMDLLRDRIVGRVRQLLPGEEAVSLNARHRTLLEQAEQHLRAIVQQRDDLLVAEELRLARVELDRITGASGVEDMLDSLFGRFCVGK